ncbi:DUF6234 family protein [Streptomyces sp. LUP30]|uniref:DUF6234 family protein n=1 Tax=Streptomyces sp. LUP30 TaxID=1890285 RepID=UPI000A413AA3|nr:DUF6234 family protein [Streptomyces sp. LUP30]
MDLPVAPPAFDATTGSRRRRRVDRGADIAAGCGLVLLELIALAVIFGLWFLSGFDLDPEKTVTTDPLWGYLVAAGGVGVLAIAAAVTAAWVDAVVTVATQAVMATLILMIFLGGGEVQSHQDRLCHDVPSAAGCMLRAHCPPAVAAGIRDENAPCGGVGAWCGPGALAPRGCSFALVVTRRPRTHSPKLHASQ